MHKRTIFSLLDTPAYGGAEEYLLTALHYLSTQGHRVVLATNNTQVKEKLKHSEFEVIDLPYRLDAIGNWKGLLKYFFSLPTSILWVIKTIQGFQNENSKFQIPNSKKIICLFPGFTDRLSFSPFVKMLGCRLIWLEYGPLEPTFERNYGFPKLLYTIGKPFVDQIITISKWTKKSLIRTGKIPAAKITVIYPGVKQDLRIKIHDSGKKGKYIITVARLAKEKEIDILLQAFAQINNKNIRLVVVGDGPEKKELEKLANELEISGRVEFTGFVAEERKHDLLSRADLFVFPSAWELEGLGMTTIEAMAQGTPVITSGFGPQAEIVDDEKTGWYFKLHDASDLARVISRLILRKDLEKMGKNGKREVERRFSQKQQQKLLKQVFDLEQLP